MDKPSQQSTNGALVITADEPRNRLILTFRNPVEDDGDNFNTFAAILSNAYERYGPGYDLVIDYRDFQPEQVSERALSHFAAGAVALDQMGFKRRVRILPERLDAFFAPFASAVSASGITVATVRTLEEAHIFLDGSG